MTLIALILTIIKLLLDLFIYVIKQISLKKIMISSSEGKSCIYLQKNENNDICSNILFEKNMLNGICPRQKCLGFKINTEVDDIAIINSTVFLTIKKIIDLFPEIAVALLALNEILFK